MKGLPWPVATIARRRLTQKKPMMHQPQREVSIVKQLSQQNINILYGDSLTGANYATANTLASYK